eukprot:TRINITY_DN7242_c0_g1_i1.p1 TRINITY_DN7242_c0_g1~~TRINITY_DN7242_c0_g1_i1.p1  ORF type:complete len:375 (+),score=38.12 TRINITY_DN7242_c0_g1_i1:110-1234(+)
MEHGRNAEDKELQNLFLPGYVFLSKLGAGSQANVYAAVRESGSDTHAGAGNSDHVAVKMYHGDVARRSLEKELRSLRAAQGHSNVVRLVESFRSDAGVNAMVLELCQEDLHTLIYVLRLPRRYAVDIIRGALSGLEYIHSIEIVHRDVKPENIAVAGDGSARLVDFGFATWLSNTRDMSRLCGTTGFQAPEMFAKRRYGSAVDMFALGATFYEAMGRQCVFETEGVTSEALAARMRQYEVAFGSNFDDVDEDTRRMIVWLMHPCDDWRADAKFALTCPPFTYDFVDDSQSVLSFEAQLLARTDGDMRPQPPPVGDSQSVLSFEAQLNARTDVDMHPQPPPDLREGLVRPTPLRLFTAKAAPTSATGPDVHASGL